jgi:hypothetical protein
LTAAWALSAIEDRKPGTGMIRDDVDEIREKWNIKSLALNSRPSGLHGYVVIKFAAALPAHGLRLLHSK